MRSTGFPTPLNARRLRLQPLRSIRFLAHLNAQRLHTQPLRSVLISAHLKCTAPGAYRHPSAVTEDFSVTACGRRRARGSRGRRGVHAGRGVVGSAYVNPRSTELAFGATGGNGFSIFFLGIFFNDLNAVYVCPDDVAFHGDLVRRFGTDEFGVFLAKCEIEMLRAKVKECGHT